MIIIHIEVEESVRELEEDISEKQNQVELLKSIDWEKPVDEDTWHEICETPMRNSDLMSILIKNTFPLAENIEIRCNYANFEMLGFKVQIPNSRCRGINVDTSWYQKDNGEPKCVYRGNRNVMKKYFDAVDSRSGWYECARLRLGNGWRKWYLFFMWWCKYKWKNPHREKWEEEFKKDEIEFDGNLKKYHETRIIMHNNAEKLVCELLPILDKFSSVHGKYNGNMFNYAIEKIREYEKL